MGKLIEKRVIGIRMEGDGTAYKVICAEKGRVELPDSQVFKEMLD